MLLREIRLCARKLQKTLHLEDWTISIHWATRKDEENFKKCQKRFKVYREYEGMAGGVFVTNSKKKYAEVVLVRCQELNELEEIITILTHEFIHLYFHGIRISRKQNESLTTIFEVIICESILDYHYARMDAIALNEHHEKYHKECKHSRSK